MEMVARSNIQCSTLWRNKRFAIASGGGQLQDGQVNESNRDITSVELRVAGLLLQSRSVRLFTRLRCSLSLLLLGAISTSSNAQIKRCATTTWKEATPKAVVEISLNKTKIHIREWGSAGRPHSVPQTGVRIRSTFLRLLETLSGTADSRIR